MYMRAGLKNEALLIKLPSQTDLTPLHDALIRVVCIHKGEHTHTHTPTHHSLNKGVVQECLVEVKFIWWPFNHIYNIKVVIAGLSYIS